MSHSYNEEYNWDFLFKIVIVGGVGVGKSNLLTRFTKDQFNADSTSTIGVDFAARTLQVDGKTVKAQLWDTAGNERFRALSNAFYRGAVGALICYDITRHDTFEAVQTWLKEVREYSDAGVVCTLVGNKSDLSNIRAVQQNEAKALCASERLSFIETSALDRSNVERAFTQVLTEIYRKLAKSRPELQNDARLAPTISSNISSIAVPQEPSNKSRCCS